MKTRMPPRAATWLLICWGSDFYGESLAGDLCEQYQEGRSRWWYWRQVAAAIFLARTRFLRQSAWTVVDAMVAAFAMIALGVGTLTWATAVKQKAEPPRQCAPTATYESVVCTLRPLRRDAN